MNHQFLKFVLVGGVAATVNIASRVLFNIVMPFEIAIVLAFFCGVIAAFVLNRTFVFKPEQNGNMRRQSFRFVLVNIVALAQVWLIGVGLARNVFPAIGFSWHVDLVAHVIGVASPIVTSFYAHKHFSFAA